MWGQKKTKKGEGGRKDPVKLRSGEKQKVSLQRGLAGA